MKARSQYTTDRYRPLESNLTDSKPLIIDTQANPQDILECAVQRLRASSDLLQTTMPTPPFKSSWSQTRPLAM
ncbi:hypothetical protein [Pseudomonas moraviensis]